MTIKLGSELTPAVQAAALASYPNRCTRDHLPAWYLNYPAGTFYKLQFDSDADWLAHTMFHVKADGTLATRSCESKPTWPDNPEERI